jgi:hypothetical protein
MVLGIFAYGYFLNSLILSSRITYFDRLAGHDRVLVFHRYLATTAFGCATGHLAFKLVYSFHLSTQVIMGIFGLVLFLTVMSITSIAMVKGLLQRVVFFQNLRRWFLTTLHFDYSGLKLFHNLTAAASLCVAVHVFLASSTQETSVRSLLMGSWAGIALALYFWHKIVRPFYNLRAAFTIDQKTLLAPGIAELSLNPGTRPLAPIAPVNSPISGFSTKRAASKNTLLPSLRLLMLRR